MKSDQNSTPANEAMRGNSLLGRIVHHSDILLCKGIFALQTAYWQLETQTLEAVLQAVPLPLCSPHLLRVKWRGCMSGQVPPCVSQNTQTFTFFTHL